MKELTEKIKNDPLAMMIHAITEAMRVDYPFEFKTEYGNHDSLRLFKRRLYKKLSAFNPVHIRDAYENWVDRDEAHLPTMPQFIREVKQVENSEKRKHEQQKESERISALPKPTVTCDPMKMLSDAKTLNAKKDNSPEAIAARKKDLMQLLNAKISTATNIIKRYASHDHQCAVNGCNKAGALSSTTTGGGIFYCADHFKMKM